MTDETSTTTTGEITNDDPRSKNTSVSLTMSTLATTITVTNTETGNSSGIKPLEEPMRQDNNKDKKRRKTKKVAKERQLKKELDPNWKESFNEEITGKPAESCISRLDGVPWAMNIIAVFIVIPVGVSVLLVANDTLDIPFLHDRLYKLDEE